MRKREIILDFTSLLDVVMLLLFFFVIFSVFETKEQQTAMQEQQAEMQAEYEQLDAEAEKKLADAEETLRRAEKYLEEVKLSDERSAENVEGINEFVKGKSLKIKLNMNSESWKLDVFRVNELLAEIQSGTPSVMAEKFSELLSEKGYSADDSILCELFFDATEGGTASAYRDVQKFFDEIKKKYPHFFLSETDISIFEEE